MCKIVSIHSFRRGTGKTTVTANLALLLAQQGYRVTAVDLNFAAPSLPHLFALPDEQIPQTLNGYIWGECDIEACVIDMSQLANPAVAIDNLFLVAASTRPSHITRIMRGGYLTSLLADACQELIELTAPDFLLVDMPAGVSEETQLLTAISDIAVVITRPARQDYQGTGILLELASRLEVPTRVLVVNQVPSQFTEAAIQAQFASVYPCDFTAVLPHSQKMMLLGSSGLFVLEYPDDTLTAVLNKLHKLF